jgi:hypothetical protein
MNSLIGFPSSAIPRLGTQAHSVLLMLLEGNHKTSELSLGLCGESPRSDLQSLMNETCNYWNIINIDIEGSSKGFYKLDPRHLSNDPVLNKQARIERFSTLLKEQKDNNQQGANKLFDSIEAWQEAESLFSPQLELSLLETKQPA